MSLVFTFYHQGHWTRLLSFIMTSFHSFLLHKPLTFDGLEKQILSVVTFLNVKKCFLFKTKAILYAVAQRLGDDDEARACFMLWCCQDYRYFW